MSLTDRIRNTPVPWATICEWLVLVLLVASVLWRGGKSLDMTWALTGVAALATIISHTALRSKSGDVPVFLWGAVTAFILLNIVGFFFSTTQNYGLDEVLRTAALGLLLLWTIRTVQSSEDRERFGMRVVHALVLTTLVACGVGILIYILQPVNRFVGTFFDHRFHTDYWPNAWADFLLLTWPLMLYAAFKTYVPVAGDKKRLAELMLRSLVVGFVLGCLLLSYSRGGILVFAMQIALWCAILYRRTRSKEHFRTALPAAVLIAVFAGLTFLGANAVRSGIYDVQDVSDKVTFSAAEGGSSVSERAQFWSQALNLAARKPFLGWGPYSFRFVQPELQSGVLATSDHAHNVFLKLLMERGMLPTILFALVVFLVLYRACVMLLARDIDIGKLTFSLRMFMVIGLTGVILHNLIDFNMQFVGIAVPFWLLLGILMTYLDIGSLRPVPQRLAQGAEAGIAAVILIIALYEGAFLVVSSLGRAAEARGDRTQALLWYDRASKGEFFTRDLDLSRAKILQEEGRLPEARAAVDSYIERNTEDYRAWKRRADIAFAAGDREAALADYQHAFARGKWNDLGILRGILETRLALEKRAEIDAERPMIDALLAAYADAIQRNAHHVALSPNVEEFIALSNLLARLYPDDAPRYQVMAAKADHHAQIERGKIRARAPGFLW